MQAEALPVPAGGGREAELLALLLTPEEVWLLPEALLEGLLMPEEVAELLPAPTPPAPAAPAEALGPEEAD
jgi:hypothetical protein